MDFSAPRVIVEYGPGEGCHTREIVRRMHLESLVILFELDPEFAQYLSEQFRADPRVTVLNIDAANLAGELERLGLAHCDYVISGIPFSILAPEKKRELLRGAYESLAPNDTAALITYQVTNELADHCRHFPRAESEYCMKNLPPMFVTKFYKTAGSHRRKREGALVGATT